MDPYEYLLSKLNVMLEFVPEFNTCSLYTKLKTGKKLITSHIPIDWTCEQIFKYYRNTFSNDFLRQYRRDIEGFCHLLQQFPNDLESIEQVDVLLAVNGLQTSDEKSS